jgi:hypothetical protein
MQQLINLIQDPKNGPKFFLQLLAVNFFWIAICHGMDANLWGETPRFDIPASTYEETK